MLLKRFNLCSLYKTELFHFHKLATNYAPLHSIIKKPRDNDQYVTW